MYDCIENIIDTAPLDMNGTASNPAKAGLFTVRKSSPLLNVKGVDFFHSMTVRRLFVTKRAIPDIQVAVAYLYTRVKEPTVSDYETNKNDEILICYCTYLFHL